MTTSLTAECILECACMLGEGPVWNAEKERLDFVDILGSALHQFDPRSGRHHVLDVGEHIGSFAPRREGGYVVAVQRGFGMLAEDGGAVEMVAPVIAADDDLRMNDGKCDPQGRFWAGSMSYRFTPGAGTLWRLDPDGSVHPMLTGLAISNGLDWTGDQRTMYFIDSMEFCVDALDFDATGGDIANRRRAVEVPNQPESLHGLTVPDGMTLDAEGALWVAVHGAGEVRRYSPDGALLQVVSIPPLSSTSVAFGGADLDELYITCAGASPEHVPHDQPGEGGIFRCRPGVRGRPANHFAG